MKAEPFRRPPMVDIPAEVRGSAWDRWTRHLTEPRLWHAAETFGDLCELSAQFCEGKLSRTPGHMGPRAAETVSIAEPLAHANRKGFLTTGSQPGEDDGGHQQRAFVDGWATPETVRQLQGLVRGTRLMMRTTAKLPRRTDGSDIVDVTRHVYPDGSVRTFTDWGALPGRRSPGLNYDRPDLIDGAVYVQICDPQWGDNSLLWQRLGQPDWDNPEPPEPETPMPTEPDVKVHHTKGCGLCGSTEPHTHTQADWRRHIDGAVDERPDLHDLRRGRWYDDTPITTTTTGSAGGAVSSIEEVRAGIMAANEHANEALGAVQQAHGSLETAQGALMRATEGSGQADVSEATGLVAQAIAGIEEIRQQISAMISAAEGVGNRL